MGYRIIDNQENEKMAEDILYRLTHGETYDDITATGEKTKSYYFELMKFYKKKWGLSKIICFYDWLNHNNLLQNFCDDYSIRKMTTMSLGEKYGINERTVASVLQRANVPIRQRGYESKTPQDIFSNITTEIQAYTIGLITADGNISLDERSCGIGLIESDGYVLEQINNELLGGTGHIVLTHQERESPLKTLRFHGKKICSDLKNFDIVPRKTYTLNALNKNIPEHLYHHYIRGLYDGDGVCSLSNHKVRIGFCGHNQSFVEDYREFMNKTLNMPKNKLFNTGNCWQVSWSAKNDLTNFYNYIYKDAHIFLGRKKKKLQDYLEKQ